MEGCAKKRKVITNTKKTSSRNSVLFPKLTLTALNEQIIFCEDFYAKVDVSGFVWGVIQQNIDEQEHWRYFHNEFWEIEQARRLGKLRGRYVDVPWHIAEEIHKSAAQGIIEVEKSFAKLCKLRVNSVTVFASKSSP